MKKSIFGCITMEMIAPAVIQPLIILFITYIIPDSIVLMSLILAVSLFLSIYCARNQLKSHFLYYWIVLSITYIIILFEFVIVPLAEISPSENFFLVLFTVLSIYFFYLTTQNRSKYILIESNVESSSESLILNENGMMGLCPTCKVKIHPKNFHCSICKECIMKYDHHSYWLNCCIGELNAHYYLAGIFFGVFALSYASLLILTTICSPYYYYFGILLPEDCTDVCGAIEPCACLVSGIYCMELAVILLFKVLHHSLLISLGTTTFEWKEQCKYRIIQVSPLKSGVVNNWIQFFKKFKNIQFDF